MSLPDVVTRNEWLAARKELLAREKEFTRQRDALNAERRRLPMTVVEKDYRFDGPDGEVSLADLFDGCGQLIIQHVMFGPDWDTICPGCNASLNALPAGILAQLRTRDTAYAAVSRAPAAKTFSRVLALPVLSKVEVSAKLCAANGVGLAKVPRRDKAAYAKARRWRWGEALFD